MKYAVTWVLLANTSFARILENKGPGEGLYQPPECTFEAADSKTYSDDEGRVQGSMSNSRLRLDKHVEYEPETEQFARELIKMLEQRLRKGQFDKLVISADPKMLGLLRQLLPGELKRVIKAELNKDLVRVPVNDIPRHLDGIVKL